MISASASTAEHAGDMLYFGYGSNLWREQMAMRCPTSKYVGVGRLPGYRWMINDRGYANVVPLSGTGSHVYGLVYKLTPPDEHTLDRNEGVPIAYTKEMLAVDLWVSQDDETPVDVSDEGERKQMLVYVDRKRTVNDQPKEEYVYRMNMGIRDGAKHGIPQAYFDQVLRAFVPARGRETFEELARRQALEFEDEE